jgi:hypothetical protein
MMVPDVARRLGAANAALDARPRALVAAAIACLNAARDVWSASDETLDLTTLLDQAMNALIDQMDGAENRSDARLSDGIVLGESGRP